MDLQNCLNFQRELVYLPPTVTQWQTLYNVTETFPTQNKKEQKKKHAGEKKNRKKKKIQPKKGKKTKNSKSKINHTDKIKTSINRTYCIMPFSWLKKKFKLFRFSSASSEEGLNRLNIKL